MAGISGSVKIYPGLVKTVAARTPSPWAIRPWGDEEMRAWFGAFNK